MTAAAMTTSRPPRRVVDPNELAATVNLIGPEAEVRSRIAAVVRQAFIDLFGGDVRTCPACFGVFRVGCPHLADSRRADAIHCCDSCRVARFRSRNSGS